MNVDGAILSPVATIQLRIQSTSTPEYHICTTFTILLLLQFQCLKMQLARKKPSGSIAAPDWMPGNITDIRSHLAGKDVTYVPQTASHIQRTFHIWATTWWAPPLKNMIEPTCAITRYYSSRVTVPHQWAPYGVAGCLPGPTVALMSPEGGRRPPEQNSASHWQSTYI